MGLIATKQPSCSHHAFAGSRGGHEPRRIKARGIVLTASRHRAAEVSSVQPGYKSLTSMPALASTEILTVRICVRRASGTVPVTGASRQQLGDAIAGPQTGEVSVSSTRPEVDLAGRDPGLDEMHVGIARSRQLSVQSVGRTASEQH